MIRPVPLKQIRPGNVRVNDPSLNMNSKREIPSSQNTLQNLHTVSMNVNRYFTDVDGAIIAKNNAGLVAANMAVSYGIPLLGQFDKEGGYSIAQKVVPPNGSAKFYLSFVNGSGMTSHQICTPFSPNNTIQRLLKNGDIVLVYTDSLTGPTYFAWIVITSGVTPIASVLANLSTKQNDNRLMKLYCYEVMLKTDFALQLSEPWNYIHIDNIGNYRSNQITYNQFNNPFNVLPDVLRFPTEFVFNQYIGIYFYMVIGVDTMAINFNLKMIQ